MFRNQFSVKFTFSQNYLQKWQFYVERVLAEQLLDTHYKRGENEIVPATLSHIEVDL